MLKFTIYFHILTEGGRGTNGKDIMNIVMSSVTPFINNMSDFIFVAAAV